MRSHLACTLTACCNSHTMNILSITFYFTKVSSWMKYDKNLFSLHVARCRLQPTKVTNMLQNQRYFLSSYFLAESVHLTIPPPVLTLIFTRSLKSNSLSYISPGALSKHTNLRTLDISNNNIHYLHNGIFDGIRLQKL